MLYFYLLLDDFAARDIEALENISSAVVRITIVVLT